MSERLRIFGAELERAFGAGPKPACTLIPVPRLALDGMLFEVEAVAVQPIRSESAMRRAGGAAPYSSGSVVNSSG
jgi:hypothetical protein